MFKVRSCLIALSLAITLAAPISAGSEVRDLEREEANRQVILEFYKDLDPNRRVKLLADNYIQHSPMLAGGKQSMVDFHNGFLKKHPNMRQRLLHVAAYGDYVWVHFRMVMEPGDPGVAAIGIFRLENGKIAEHWDVSQPARTSIANNN